MWDIEQILFCYGHTLSLFISYEKIVYITEKVTTAKSEFARFDYSISHKTDLVGYGRTWLLLCFCYYMNI